MKNNLLVFTLVQIGPDRIVGIVTNARHGSILLATGGAHLDTVVMEGHICPGASAAKRAAERKPIGWRVAPSSARSANTSPITLE